jgi:hypothetical protein
MFHLRHGEMAPTLQDVTVLLGLSIDRRAVKSIGVCNMIVLCERSFKLTPHLSELKEVTPVLNGFRRHFQHY